MTIIAYTKAQYKGLSSDTKPTTGVPEGADFWETDTNVHWKYDADTTTWSLDTGFLPQVIAATGATTAEKGAAAMSGGAQCDGTDDYSQINAGFATTIGNLVQLTTGTYTLGATGVILDRAGQRLIGQGAKTIVTSASAINLISSSCHALGSGNYNSHYIGRMKLNGADAANYGVFTDGMSRGTLDHLIIADCLKFGIWVADEYGHSMTIIKPFITGCGNQAGHSPPHYYGGIKLGYEWDTGAYPDNLPAITTHIIDPIIEDCHDGIWILGGNCIDIDHPIIEDIDEHGIVVYNDGAGYYVRELSIRNAYFEAIADDQANHSTGCDIYIWGAGYAQRVYMKVDECYPSTTAADFIQCAAAGSGYVDIEVNGHDIGTGITPNDAVMTGGLAHTTTHDHATSALLNATATTDKAVVFTQPANTVLTGASLILSEQFVAVDLTNLTITIGVDGGDVDGIMTVTGNLTSSAADTQWRTKGALFTNGELYSATAADYSAFATATGANLSALTAGKIVLNFKYRYV